MLSERTNRVAYPFAHSAKGWGIARSATALLLLAGTAALPAQMAPCGITSVKGTSQLVYPPIARAAHVGGTVILLVRFGQNGGATNAAVLSGSQLLQGAAVDFVKSWRTNEYTGPRECPIAITFSYVDGPSVECGTPEAKSRPPSPPPHRIDIQHFVITSPNTCYIVMRDAAPLQPTTFSATAGIPGHELL